MLFRRVSVAVALAGVLVIAGCGSSGNSSSISKSASSGSKSAGTASSSGAIVIGNIGSYSGPEASSIGPGQAVIKAWAREVNATGGINGRQVKLISVDDALSPPTGLQEAKQLITQDQVVAIVGASSLTAPVWAPIAAKAGVPVIGGYSSFPPFGTNPDFFPSGSTYYTQMYATMLLGKQFGRKYANLYCVESPLCKAQAGVTQFVAPSLGMSSFITSVSAAATNYTAQCQALKANGAQSYFVTEAASVALKVIDTCVAQGVTAKPLAAAGVATGAWLTDPAVQGLVNEEPDFPYFLSSTPATKAYHALLAKYGLGDGGGGGGTYPYVGAKLFQAAAESVGSAQVTPQSLTAALYKMRGETLGGLVPPLTFTKGTPPNGLCWFQSRIENHKWTAPVGLKPACAPPAVIAAAIAKFG